jgi:hypothetical protein
MFKLTDTQLVTLSAASQREDRGIVLPSNLKGGAAQKLVAKLIELGLVEEIRARGDLPVWRRDDDNRPMALRITKRGLKAIAADEPGDESGASNQPEAAEQNTAPAEAKPPRKKRRRGASRGWRRESRTRQSRKLEASSDHRTPPAAGGCDDHRHHESDGMAAALGARLLCRCRAQEAGADTGLGEGRG